jgi:hypothetical protein
MRKEKNNDQVAGKKKKRESEKHPCGCENRKESMPLL